MFEMHFQNVRPVYPQAEKLDSSDLQRLIMYDELRNKEACGVCSPWFFKKPGIKRVWFFAHSKK